MNHAIDTTALLAEVHPISAIVEVASGMSVDASINARIFSTYINYLGLGYLFSKGRDFSRYKFGIASDTPEKIQRLHDALYTSATTFAVAPPIYAVSNYFAKEDIDFYKIGISTLALAVVAFFNGWPVGYAVDVFRDLTGVKECERSSYPKILKKQTPKMKKAIAAGLIAASLGFTGLVYSLASNKQQVFNGRKETEHSLSILEIPLHKLERELYFE